MLIGWNTKKRQQRRQIELNVATAEDSNTLKYIKYDIYNVSLLTALTKPKQYNIHKRAINYFLVFCFLFRTYVYVFNVPILGNTQIVTLYKIYVYDKLPTTQLTNLSNII